MGTNKSFGYFTYSDDEGRDPACVKIEPSYFEWKSAKPMVNLDEFSVITKFYEVEENRPRFYDASKEVVAEEALWFPKMLMVPAEIGLHLVKHQTTPWELYKLCKDFVDDKEEELGELMATIVM